MKNIIFIVSCILCFIGVGNSQNIKSPSGELKMHFSLAEDGTPLYSMNIPLSVTNSQEKQEKTTKLTTKN